MNQTLLNKTFDTLCYVSTILWMCHSTM